jgi:hypothetical protein
MEKDLDDLLDRAKYGHVSDAEIAWVTDALERRDPRYDLYRLIHIVGRVGTPGKHENLVAEFLDSPNDPMLSRISLITLDNWGLFEKYRDVILAFCRGVDWDYEGDVRLVALNQTGKYLATSSDCTLLVNLIDVAADVGEDIVIRRAGLDGLAIALGAAAKDLPAVLLEIDPGGSWASEVLDRAWQRYKRECGRRQ